MTCGFPGLLQGARGRHRTPKHSGNGACHICTCLLAVAEFEGGVSTRTGFAAGTAMGGFLDTNMDVKTPPFPREVCKVRDADQLHLRQKLSHRLS